MPASLEDWIKKYYSGNEVQKVEELLAFYGTKSWHREVARVHRDAVIISRGSLDKLQKALHLADVDYRDVLIGEQVDPWLIRELQNPPRGAGS